MAAQDVVTSSALQLMSMAAKGREEGVFVATVTVPVNKTDGEVGGPAPRQTKGERRVCSKSLLLWTGPALTCHAVEFP